MASSFGQCRECYADAAQKGIAGGSPPRCDGFWDSFSVRFDRGVLERMHRERAGGLASIPREIVESTAARVASMPPRDARRAMERAAGQQPALLAYVMAATEDERAPVHELAIFLYFVVLQIFEAGAGRPVPAIDMDAVASRAEANDEALERLEKGDDGVVDRAAEMATSRQPAVVGYVVASVFARGDAEADDAIGEDEAGFVFVILRTVIDLLDEAMRAEA
jgi:hypothetical protein